MAKRKTFFRKSVDSRLALMTVDSSFLVRKRPGMSHDYLQRLVSSYVCIFQNTEYSKTFRTQKVENGIKVYRTR